MVNTLIIDKRRRGYHNNSWINYSVLTDYNFERESFYTSEIQKYQNYIRKLRAYRKKENLCNPRKNYWDIHHVGIWSYEDIVNLWSKLKYLNN